MTLRRYVLLAATLALGAIIVNIQTLYAENPLPYLDESRPIDARVADLLSVEAIIVNDDSKRKYLLIADNVQKLYKAVLPDPTANEFFSTCSLFRVIGEKIRSLMPIADISSVKEAMENLLDESIASEGYIIQPGGEVVDFIWKTLFLKIQILLK